MSEVDVMWTILMEICMLAGMAYLFGILAQRFLQSAIIGYLLAGSVTAFFFPANDAVVVVAELGVALLLFSIGLELSFRQLKVIGKRVLAAGILQVTVTMVLASVGLSFFLPPAAAVVIGAAMALSSTAIVLRVIQSSGEVDSARGRFALGVLLVQDLAVVPLVLMVSLMGGDGGFQAVILELGKTVLAVTGLMLVFYLLFYRFIPWLLRAEGLFANRELTMLLAVLSGLGSTWSAHAVGLSPALGAFAAGILLAESPFATQIRSDTEAIRTLFVTLFFTSVGLLLDLGWVLQHIHLLVPAVILLLVIKAGIIVAIFKLLRMNAMVSLATGITLGQAGEFAFVIMAAARDRQLLGGDVLNGMVAVSLLSMFAAPYMVRYAEPLARRLLPRAAMRSGTTSTADTGAPGCAALVVGWGPAGREAASALMDVGLRPEIIELNPASRKSIAEAGFALHLGDATRSEVLSHAGIKEAGVVVVTTPDSGTAHDIIRTVRTISPDVPLVARGRYHRHVARLRRAGADIVVDEEQEVGYRLAGEVRQLVSDFDMTALFCRLTGRPVPDVGSKPDPPTQDS